VVPDRPCTATIGRHRVALRLAAPAHRPPCDRVDCRRRPGAGFNVGRRWRS
jgi:hypothetical protein